MTVIIAFNDDIIKGNMLLKNKFKIILKRILFAYNSNKLN